MNAVTLLHAQAPRPLAKTWKADGKIDRYPKLKTFSCSSRPVGGIRALSELLAELEGTPRAAIIRGELRKGIDPGSVQRNNATFEDVPRSWLALDVDDFEPAGADPMAEPASGVAEFLAAHLPEFEGAAYHWQLTGSAGHPSATGKLKARIWFWLDEPRTSQQLKAWAKARWQEGGAPPFDTALFGATQLHYTAAPMFEEGVVDPVPVRSGFVEGAAAVSVPLEGEAVAAPCVERQPVGEVSDAYARRALAGIYQDLEEAPPGGRNGVLYQKARRAFSLVHAGKADGVEVRADLEAAASASGLDAEEIAATLDSAWGASKAEPDAVAPLAGDAFEGERPPVVGPSLTLPQESPQEAAQARSGGNGGRSLGFTMVGELVGQLKPIAWQVKGYLEADSLGLIYGPPKSGKSFLAIDWACCIATGTPWNGHPVQQGAVFYLAGEGHNGLSRRFTAWEKAKGVPLAAAPLAISDKAAPLTDRDAAAEVLHAINRMAEKHGAPALIVVDTLARNFGADENSTEDMGRFVQHLDEIRANWKCTVLVVHHTGKDESRGARGNSSLTGAIDAGYLVKRDATGSVTFEPTEMKDAELPPPISFALESVKVPLIDEDGSDVFGAYLVPGGAPASPTRGRRRGKNQATALAELARLAQEHEAEMLRAGRGPGPVWVELEEWRQACREAEVDRRRWSDVLSALEEAGDVHVDGHHVQLAGAATGASPQRQPVGGKGASDGGGEITTPFYASQGAGCPVLSAPLGGADRTGHRQEHPTGQTGAKPDAKPDTNRTPRVKPSVSCLEMFSAEEPPPGWRRRGAGRQPAGDHPLL